MITGPPLLFLILLWMIFSSCGVSDVKVASFKFGIVLFTTGRLSYRQLQTELDYWNLLTLGSVF